MTNFNFLVVDYQQKKMQKSKIDVKVFWQFSAPTQSPGIKSQCGTNRPIMQNGTRESLNERAQLQKSV